MIFMKAKITLFVLAVIVCSVQYLSATVIQLSAPNDLYTYVNSMNDGDIIELISTNYEYTWRSQLAITTEKNITIRAKSGLAGKPVVRFTNTTASAFIRYNSSSTAIPTKKWKFEGITFDGYNATSAISATGFFVSNLTYPTYGIAFEANECEFKNFSDNILLFQGSTAPGSPTLAQAGKLTLTNCEFRNFGRNAINSSSSLTYTPDSTVVRNCLFDGSSAQGFIVLSRTNYKHFFIDHCTFLNSTSRELNLARSTNTSYIQNSLFVNNTNTTANVYTPTIGTDCGIYYTGTGTKATIYPNSTSARNTNPALDTRGIATASGYLSGSTDGLPVGYYGTQITLSERELTDLNYQLSNGPSAARSFLVSGERLTSNLTITAPANFEVSTSAGTGYSSSLTLTPSGKAIASTAIYIRLKSELQVGVYTGTVSVSSTGSASKSLSVAGNVTEKPTIFTSITTLSGFNYTFGSGPSTQQQFILNGSSLTGNAIITAPAGYEISLTSGVSFSGAGTLNIASIGGKITNLIIYTRLKSALTAGSYTGNITITSTGADTKIIALAGSVTAAPVVITTNKTALTNFSYNYGSGPSAIQSFTVSGTGITDYINITAPANYEISTTTGTSFSGKSSIALSTSTGTIAATTIYVRLIKDLAVGVYNEAITFSATGGTSKQLNLGGFVSISNGIALSTTAISGLSYTYNNGPSAERSFVITGNNLSSYIIVTAPANYEVSTGSGTSFSGAGQMLLDPTSINGTQLTVYIRLATGLTTGNYNGTLSVSSSGSTTRNITITGSVYDPVTIKTDAAIYPARLNGGLTITSKWLLSKNTSNYSASNEIVAASGMARDVALRNGKLLFMDRGNKQIVIIDGSTGLKESPLVLNTSLFSYTGRNKANTADSTYLNGTLQFYGIKTDNSKNVLINNQTSSSAERFQIYKIDMATGNGTLIIDQANMATLFPAASAMRFDFFDVWGDVNTNAVILAPNGASPAMEIYKWVISDGVAEAPTVIRIDNTTIGTYLTGLENLGGYPRIYPVAEDKYYIDGGGTYPTLISSAGTIESGFYKRPGALTDSVTVAGQKWTMNSGNNGLCEFSLGNNYFFLSSATISTSSPASAFRLFRFQDAARNFETIDCMWTFPQAGFGSATNSYRTAVPLVETNGNTANVYLYCGENGYAKYEVVYNPDVTAINNTSALKPGIRLYGDIIQTDETCERIELYNCTGQLIQHNIKTNRIKKPVEPGIYILKFSCNDKQFNYKIQIK